MLFDNDPDDPNFLCFEQNRIRSILEIISYDEPKFLALTYMPNDPNDTKVKISDDDDDKATNLKSTTTKQSFMFPATTTSGIPLEDCFQVQIKILQGCVSHCIDIDEPITDYSLITSHQINQYRVSNEYKIYVKSGVPPQHKPNYAIDSEDTTLTAFKRGIKRDHTHFNDFKRYSDWDEWESHIKITATGQGVKEILDGSYIPKGIYEKTLFQEKTEVYVPSLSC